MATLRRIRPTPTNDDLRNPHRGICTFQHFNGDELYPDARWDENGPTVFPLSPGRRYLARDTVKGYLPSTVAYCRWFWRVIEPVEGKYDFTVIDQSLEMCRQRKQTLAVRLMAFGSVGETQMPEWYAKKYPVVSWKHGNRGPITIPVHDSKEYFEKWGGLIREFARRYDGHELLESVDLAITGPWGEGAGDTSDETIGRFTQLYKQVHPKTQLLCQIDDNQFGIGLRAGLGWRADCFGDIRCFESLEVRKDLSFNHTFDAYPQQVHLCGATDQWKTAPVHLEVCGVPLSWFRDNYDIDLILQQGLKFHATYFMPKYTYLPDEWIEKFKVFCRHLGYRYILRQAQLPTQVQAGGNFEFRTWIENVGVAPIYRRYDLVLRLRQEGAGEFFVPLADVDIRQWLPGDFVTHRTLPLPAGLRPGWAEVCVGLVDPASQAPRVRFAVNEQYSDGWVDLGGMEITA